MLLQDIYRKTPAGTLCALFACVLNRIKEESKERRRRTMRAKWLIGIGLSVFLAAPIAVAQEAEGEAAQKKVMKQEKKLEQKKAQEQKQLKKQ
jgi:hypothetical protein